MQDSYRKDIHVGNMVAVHWGSTIRIGKVTRLTPKKVEVKCADPYSTIAYHSCLVYPKRVVVIDELPAIT